MSNLNEIFQPVSLRTGSGNGDPRDGLCIMQMVDWFSGSVKVSDTPSCACPALTQYAILLNDSATDEQRDSLWPLVWKLLNSKDESKIKLRVEFIVRETTRRIVAPLFEGVLRENLIKAVTMTEIQIAARAAADAAHAARAAAAYDAADAADAAADAADAAHTAYAVYNAAAAYGAAADARAAAGYAAADAAVAAIIYVGYAARVAAGYAAADAVRANWEKSKQILTDAIELGNHGDIDPVYINRAMELKELLDTV